MAMLTLNGIVQNVFERNEVVGHAGTRQAPMAGRCVEAGFEIFDG